MRERDSVREQSSAGGSTLRSRLGPAPGGGGAYHAYCGTTLAAVLAGCGTTLAAVPRLLRYHACCGTTLAAVLRLLRYYACCGTALCCVPRLRLQQQAGLPRRKVARRLPQTPGGRRAAACPGPVLPVGALRSARLLRATPLVPRWARGRSRRAPASDPLSPSPHDGGRRSGLLMARRRRQRSARVAGRRASGEQRTLTALGHPGPRRKPIPGGAAPLPAPGAGWDCASGLERALMQLLMGSSLHASTRGG